MDDTVAKKIFCVDHDEQVLGMLSFILSRSGYQFSQAHSGAQAYIELSTNAHLPDLILLDLPADETWEFCQKLHQSPTLSLIPLVIVNTVHSVEEKKQAMALGAVAFLSKPISQKHLLNIIEQYSETKNQWMQNFNPSAAQTAPQSILRPLKIQPEQTEQPPPLIESFSNQALKWTEFQDFIAQNFDIHDEPFKHFSSNQLYRYTDVLHINAYELSQIVAEFLHLPYLESLENCEIALGLIPTAFCKKSMVLPILERNGSPAFVVCNPFDIETTDLLKSLFKSFRLLVTAPDNMQSIFDNPHIKTIPSIHPALTPSATVAPQFNLDEHDHLVAASPNSPSLSHKKWSPESRLLAHNLQEQSAHELEKKLIQDYLQKQNKQSEHKEKSDLSIESDDIHEIGPIIQLVNMLIVKAYGMGASDIHIEPAENDVIVRYRIDGELKIVHRLQPHGLIFPLITRLKIMSRLNIVEHRLPQDGRIVFSEFFPDMDFDLRLAIAPVNYGEKAVLRILDKKKTLLSLDKLGFSSHNLGIYREKIKTPYGMILHVGPTGSGKSMTLYAALNEVLSEKINIQTIEDPIEYTLPGISQLEVHPEIGLTFARGLRSFLRQDPDVILVGEIRDQETARIAIEASLTGHLLLSTLHTNDAPSTVIRLIEMGLDNYLLSSSLVLICAQRLLRRLCVHCREPYQATPGICLKLGADETQKIILYRPIGCDECEQTGYKGRTGVHELLVLNDLLRKAINDPRITAEDLKKLAVAKAGMITLYWDAMAKVVQGITSLEEALAKIKSDEFDSRPHSLKKNTKTQSEERSHSLNPKN